ncbi:glutamine--tRNA ligase [Buchnera aphidicola]|uniref:Glutamine--tRNA ligase n=1 Tax=Buchnera aphidicola (Stegophylla sp.) TaxID=2315800 RepID=A0A4D6YBE2_9GAMM|nr:glutamine--tRNA ligase [Buchnera aphidicola (Stegophylla sp.)]QCI26422.1 glutamine--tRNA ligase [Buchnera aphidicola (Stegophylla sp.)]
MKLYNRKYNISFIHKIINHDIKKNKNLCLHTRFAPEPNGYLHIGHAKAIVLNFELAKQFHGRCNLRFDDTNPQTENIKYINAIKRDILWLGYKWYKKIQYSSNHFEKIYQYALQLIKKKLAYVDKLKKNDIQKYRGTLNSVGINSPYRHHTIKENIFLLQQMKDGKIPEGYACLRAKINMKSSYIILRDPILYRIKFDAHHQTKISWCIYPTYDFAHCISDALENITHSLCTLEFQDNRRLYKWILNNINIIHHTRQYEYSRVHIEYSTLSKRKLKLLIQNNIIQHWNDPRILTIAGLKKKGYTPSSIINFCNKIGVTKQNNLIEFSVLEHCIRNELNKTAHRTMAILEPIPIILYNIPNQYEEIINILNHPHYSHMGSKHIIFNNHLYIEKSDFKEHPENQYNRLILGKKIKLKYSYVIQAQYIEKDKHKNIIKIFCTCNLKNKNNKKKYGIIHWLSKKQSTISEFRLYNHIFTVKNPEHHKNLLSIINNKSKIKKYGFINKSIYKKNFQNITYQFERIGYFFKDKKLSNSNNIIFHRTVSMKNKIK